MTLEEFLASNLDPRELKRAWAVRMGMQALKHREIPPMLGLHSSDLSPWESGYRWRWVSGVGLPHQGSSGYLNHSPPPAVIDGMGPKTPRTCGKSWTSLSTITASVSLPAKLLGVTPQCAWGVGIKGEKKLPDTMNVCCCSTIKWLLSGSRHIIKTLVTATSQCWL